MNFGGRLGITLPLGRLEFHEHREPLEHLIDAGYGEVWAGEVNGTDAPAPLALCASWFPDVVLSCAVVSAFTRGPALLASTAAALGEIGPGRSRFGIGAGSAPINRWNGLGFERPLTRVREALRFVRAALAGNVSEGGFRLSRLPACPPSLVLGAVGPAALALAVEEADGAVLNFVSAGDVRRLRSVFSRRDRRRPEPLELSSGIFVALAGDGASADRAARRHLAGYLTVPTYAAHMERLGRGDALAGMAEAWAKGDRRTACEQIPAEVVSDLVVSGTPDECARRINAYFEAGLQAATVSLVFDSGDVPPLTRQVEFLSALAGAARTEVAV